jgi:hypothetical protein
MSRPRGPRRYDFPRDPAAVLRELRAMREKVGESQSEVILQGPIYRACEAIRHKIDDLAAWLTGNPGIFLGTRLKCNGGAARTLAALGRD